MLRVAGGIHAPAPAEPPIPFATLRQAAAHHAGLGGFAGSLAKPTVRRIAQQIDTFRVAKAEALFTRAFIRLGR